jgi:hypothetical protein
MNRSRESLQRDLKTHLPNLDKLKKQQKQHDIDIPFAEIARLTLSTIMDVGASTFN